MTKTFHLSKALQPAIINDLIRIGNDQDGGYFVSENDIRKSNNLLSFGLSDDWSFEENFFNINDCPTDVYDASVSGCYFTKNFLKSLFRIWRVKSAVQKLLVLIGYLNFFTGKVRHIELFVGELNGLKTICFEDIMDNYTENAKTFLKMDIEGEEIRLLEDIIKHKNKFSSIVMEVHNFDLHSAYFYDFAERLNFEVIAVNVNNYGGYARSGLPKVIEITFSNIKKKSERRIRVACQKNDPDGFDCNIEFSK